MSVISTVLKIIDMSVDFSWSTSLLSSAIAAFRTITPLVAHWPHSHTAILAARASIVELKSVTASIRALLIMPKMVASSLEGVYQQNRLAAPFVVMQLE
ncbi:hypothetical protein H5410_002556 [Solanum commersonii]|uniref:Uncharacterized protein n=1 Tax=Solanum commersonii TaxID=4109 RepID=A0A9J6B363_SOLCO|nr:hypothetical protein H5410_002556 [Solanum commersonii]